MLHLTTSVLPVALLGLSMLLGANSRSLNLKSCNKNGTNKVSALILDINPDPVEIPGQFTVGGTIEALEDMNSTYSAYLTITRETFYVFYVDLPCIATGIHPDLKIGTCQYDDLCRVLDVLVEEFGNKDDNSTQCPDYFNQITPPAPCHCPLPKGIYKLAPHTFKVKELSTLYSVFASGVFDVKVVVKDTATDEIVTCLEGGLKIGDAKHHNQTAILEHPVVSGMDPIVG